MTKGVIWISIFFNIKLDVLKSIIITKSSPHLTCRSVFVQNSTDLHFQGMLSSLLLMSCHWINIPFPCCTEGTIWKIGCLAPAGLYSHTWWLTAAEQQRGKNPGDTWLADELLDSVCSLISVERQQEEDVTPGTGNTKASSTGLNKTTNYGLVCCLCSRPS